MKRYFNFVIIFTVLISCFGKAHAQNVTAEANISKTTMKIGEQAVLHISVHVPAKTTVDFPVLGYTITNKLQIVKTAKPDTSFDKSNPGSETIMRSYTLTAFDDSLYIIPQYNIHTSAGDAKTNMLTLQVTTVKVDTTKEVYDIKQPFAVSYGFWDWLKDNWIWCAIGIGIGLLIVLIIHFLTRGPKKEVVKKQEPRIPVHILAINKLNALRDKKLWQQEQVKLYYSELSDVLREYLEQRYNIHTLEQTTDEIFISLKHVDITAEARNKLKQVLVLSDLVKFAKEKPVPAENEQSMDTAIDFVMLTQQQIQLPENKEDLPK